MVSQMTKKYGIITSKTFHLNEQHTKELRCYIRFRKYLNNLMIQWPINLQCGRPNRHKAGNRNPSLIVYFIMHIIITIYVTFFSS